MEIINEIVKKKHSIESDAFRWQHIRLKRGRQSEQAAMAFTATHNDASIRLLDNVKRPINNNYIKGNDTNGNIENGYDANLRHFLFFFAASSSTARVDLED